MRCNVFLSHFPDFLERAAFDPVRERIGVAFRAFLGFVMRDFGFEPVLDGIGD
jgi:hypothetical protein